MLPARRARPGIARPVFCQSTAFPARRLFRHRHFAIAAQTFAEDLLKAVRTLAAGLEREKLDGKLWVVEAGRIRVFQEQQND